MSQPSPLQASLDALARPLAFAAADDFATLDRVKDLGATVSRICGELLARDLPPDLRRDLERVAALFAEPLEGDALRRAVSRTLALLEPCRQLGWGDVVLSRSLDALPGVGPKRAEAFARRGLASLGDLLYFLPAGYEDRRSLVRVEDLEVGRRATFIAEVRHSEVSTQRGRRARLRRVRTVVVGDDTGTVNLKWFHGADAIEGLLREGRRLLVTGDVRRYRFSKELVHPEVEAAEDEGEEAGETSAEPAADEFAGLRRVVPRYSTPEGVPPRTLRRLVQRAVVDYADLAEAHLPPALVRERNLPTLSQAIRTVHRPPPDADADCYERFASAAHERLVLEELYLLELGLLLRRDLAAAQPGIAIALHPAAAAALEAALPFALTPAQQRVWREIRDDLARPHPMNRLVQGDVGSGKTVLAWLAAAAAAGAGWQTALMAPTELLAEQHYRTLSSISSPAVTPSRTPLRVALLSGSLPRAEARVRLAAIEAEEVDLVIGTHALLGKDVHFARLALTVVDEQHRFGVEQRARVAEQSHEPLHPHNLVMTATPIPRTLALTVYGDLDVSVVDELPPGRSPVETVLLREGEGQRVVDLIRAAASRGEQTYVVYPLVEESEKVDLRSALQSAERIRAAFPELRVEVVHGRLDPRERDGAMTRFREGRVDILVSTTVIEVGVDVPAATLMVIEHAERFGLAQLHQLRGRVGRGAHPGTCVMVARGGGADGEARLGAMLETTDGFRIAEADLRIRGPGDFIGTRQSGHLPPLQVADLVRDARLVSVAREAAHEQLRRDPGLSRDAALLRAVEARWGTGLAFLGVG